MAFTLVENSVINHELGLMGETLDKKNIEISNLHLQAQSDLIFALKNPIFEEYFELQDTKNGNSYQEGVLQFSEEQQAVKQEMEEWVSSFQEKYQVDESSVVDSTGQEHLKIVFSRVISDKDLSSERNTESFFVPSFGKNFNEVHIEKPYISSDSKRKVFSYSSPIAISNNEKPAILHLEIPFLIFEDIVRTNAGRIYVIDNEGNVIVDSKNLENSDFTRSKSGELPSIYSDENYSHLQPVTFSENNFLDSEHDGKTYWYVTKSLFNFDWIMVYEKPLSSMLQGDTNLEDLENTMLLIAGVFGGGGFITTVLVSIFLARPIRKLADECKAIEKEDQKHEIVISSNDETKDVAITINSMIKELSKKEKLSTVGELGARLAHDMRNPLSVIKANIELLKISSKKGTIENKKEYERIGKAIKRMAHQVDEVLDYVKERPVALEKIILNDFMNEILENVDRQNVEFKVSPSDLSLEMDPTQMHVALINLITNGLYAAGEQGKVIIRIKDNSETVNFQVEDSGPGIPEDLLEKVFDPLFTTKQVGTGLGLASCRRIIEAHGGKLTFRNNPTVFEFNLPKHL